MSKHISKNLEETKKIANDFVKELSPKKSTATVVGLYGNLGAGKTTFVQDIAEVLGVEETVTSPTFVIMKSYLLSHKSYLHFIHIDAYRIEHSLELLHLGWQEIISNPENMLVIEWPERVSLIMPEHIKISLKTLDNPNSREIEVI